MVNYRLIIEYHQKGNNNTQVATLCSCSRMTVWKVLNRIRDIEISIDELSKLDNEELKNIIFPEYKKKGVGFLIPDFKWEEFQMWKHQSSFCCIIYKNAIVALGKAKAKCDKLHDYEMNVAPYSERKAIYCAFTTCPLLSLQNNSGFRKLCRHSATSIINQWNLAARPRSGLFIVGIVYIRAAETTR